ncbi:hypothetical protein, partial [Streptococcus sobrinus]|uniref:hypothetical protein n=1 Tax=Streptococcus sobrinus TaxID=1310 RepID=UPI000497B923
SPLEDSFFILANTLCIVNNFVRNFFKKFHQLSKFAQRFPRNYQKQVFLMSSHKKRLLAKSF